jgi:hypothetical protein
MPRCGSNVVEILTTVIIVVVFTADVGILLIGWFGEQRAADRSKTGPAFNGEVKL